MLLLLFLAFHFDQLLFIFTFSHFGLGSFFNLSGSKNDIFTSALVKSWELLFFTSAFFSFKCAYSFLKSYVVVEAYLF